MNHQLLCLTALLALGAVCAFPKFGGGGFGKFGGGFGGGKFDPFFNPYDKLEVDDPCKPKCEEKKPECKSPCEVDEPKSVELKVDSSFFAEHFSQQSSPKPQVISLHPPIADTNVEVLLDSTVCEENPFPSKLNPSFTLSTKLQGCKEKLVDPPCQPHPWCFTNRKGHFFHEKCIIECPCPIHLWGKWCCDPEFACLAPHEKWDIARSFGKGHGKSFKGHHFNCGGFDYGHYGGGYHHGGYGGFDYYGGGFGGFHGGYHCGGGYWKK